MKTIILILISTCSYGQSLFTIQQPDDSPKENYTHILIYREWEQGYVQSGSNMSIDYKWKTKIVGFSSLDNLLKWINSSNYYSFNGESRPDVKLAENQIIGIYDLTTAKEIEVKLKVEEKSLPKRVEIQEEKWTEKSYVLKRGGGN